MPAKQEQPGYVRTHTHTGCTHVIIDLFFSYGSSGVIMQEQKSWRFTQTIIIMDRWQSNMAAAEKECSVREIKAVRRRRRRRLLIYEPAN